jgi:hypothetical protein
MVSSKDAENVNVSVYPWNFRFGHNLIYWARGVRLEDGARAIDEKYYTTQQLLYRFFNNS